MDLNSERKKKAGYRSQGILTIPKDVMLIMLGVVLCFMDEIIVGICAIAAGVIALLISIYYLKKGKDK